MEDWSKHFYYDPSIPHGIRWNRFASNNRIKPGSPAGSKKLEEGKNYYSVNCQYVAYPNHRIIWEMFNGEIPEGKVIDHIDGNPSNNCIENLNLTDYRGNAYNCKMNKNNTSGVNGVTLRHNGRNSWYWTAQWNSLDGKRKCKNFSIGAYGYDLALELAIEARMDSEKELSSQGIKISERHGK